MEGTCSTFLKPQLLEYLAKLLMFAQVWKLNMDATTQPRAKVRGAGEYIAQVLIPHELMALLFEAWFNLQGKCNTTFNNLINGVSTLHLDVYSSVIAPTFVSPVQKRVKTSFMLPPFCMEMTRRWSSSFTQTRKVLSSLCLKAVSRKNE